MTSVAPIPDPRSPSPSLLGPTSYHRHGFTQSDQERLAAAALRLTNKNVNIMLSNSDTPLVRALYSESRFRLIQIQARQAGALLQPNSQPNGRGPITELLITNF